MNPTNSDTIIYNTVAYWSHKSGSIKKQHIKTKTGSKIDTKKKINLKHIFSKHLFMFLLFVFIFSLFFLFLKDGCGGVNVQEAPLGNKLVCHYQVWVGNKKIVTPQSFFEWTRFSHVESLNITVHPVRETFTHSLKTAFLLLTGLDAHLK